MIVEPSEPFNTRLNVKVLFSFFSFQLEPNHKVMCPV